MILLTFLNKYRKPLIIVGIVFFLISYIYYRGYKNATLQQNNQVLKEVEQRNKETWKVIESTEKTVRKIKRHRQNKPLDDKRDSCILSNDPFKTKCIP